MNKDKSEALPAIKTPNQERPAASKRRTNKFLTDLIRFKVAHSMVCIGGVEKLAEDWITDGLVLDACQGDADARKEVLDRLEGRPQVSVHVTDDEYVVVPPPPVTELVQDAEIVEEKNADQG